MPRSFREIQFDMDRAFARLELSHDRNERRSLFRDLKRLVLECQNLTDAPPLELHRPAIGAVGLAGQSDELTLAILEILVKRNKSANNHKP